MFEYGPHCNGCAAYCKIEIKSCTCSLVKDKEIKTKKHNCTHEQIANTQKICKKLCTHYNKQSETDSTNNKFYLKQDIHCNGCDKKCQISYNPNFSNLVKIGDTQFAGTHASAYDALLFGLEKCKQCIYHKTK